MNRFITGMLAAGVLVLAVLTIPSTSAANGGPGRASLTGFAALPASTFVPGSEPSGSLLGSAPINGVTPPFANQPVQGFSGILRRADGSYDALSDNGYGTQENSADFILRIHRIAPTFATRPGPAGTVDVLGGMNLTDPDGHVHWPLTRLDRILTGADFDPESFVRAPDGSYWVGDEFGPFLLHFDRAGRLLAPPVPLPGVKAPENPTLVDGEQPNLPGSRGFEGTAISPDGRTLYPLLEGTVDGDSPGSLRMYEFNLRTESYTGHQWTYQLANPAHSIGDAIAVDGNRLLVIERDGNEGDAAAFKHIYLVDRRDLDHDGSLDKTLVADLLDLANPRNIGGFPATFRFPFFTIESVIILDDRTLGVLNDNNFPSSAGRTPGEPDNNEFITIRLEHRLHADRGTLP